MTNLKVGRPPKHTSTLLQPQHLSGLLIPSETIQSKQVQNQPVYILLSNHF